MDGVAEGSCRPVDALIASQTLMALQNAAFDMRKWAATMPREGILLLRWLGPAAPVRAALASAIPACRDGLLGLPRALPRLWMT